LSDHWGFEDPHASFRRLRSLRTRGPQVLPFCPLLDTLSELSGNIPSPSVGWEMKAVIVLILITLIPTLELRASIPYGILRADMGWSAVFIVCTVTNIVLGPLVYLFLDKAVGLLLRFERIDRLYRRTVARTQRRIQRSVDRYGEMGVALFIGVPLPGTGSYSGALGAYLLGLGYRKFIVANVIGVLMAGTIVTTVVLSGLEAFHVLIKII